MECQKQYYQEGRGDFSKFINQGNNDNGEDNIKVMDYWCTFI